MAIQLQNRPTKVTVARGKKADRFEYCKDVASLKLTANAPENRPPQ